MRGDSYLIYPQWHIEAIFGSSNSDVSGYSVLIWADNGQVHNEGPQARFRSASTTSSLDNSTTISITAILIIPFTLGLFYTVKQAGNRRWTNKGACILIVAILASPIIIQPASANTSGIFGSTHNVAQAELNLDSSLTDYIYGWSQYRDLTRLNYYGTNTVDITLAAGARAFGDDYALVFYIGHGGPQGGGEPYVITDNSGNDVSDSDIYDNSYWSTANKFVMIWSCEQGDAITGMPHAWLHTNDLSSDAYQSPDSSGQEFIGWNGEAPYLSYDFSGTAGDTAYWFLYYFYWYSLTQYFTSNAALDIASFLVFQTSFGGGYDESPFYSGVEWEGSAGNMVTYGDGNIYPTGQPPSNGVDLFLHSIWLRRLPSCKLLCR